MGVLLLLRDVAADGLGLGDDTLRERARHAVQRGVRCILDSQVVVDRRRTVWGAQHHPLTLDPVGPPAPMSPRP
jgi:PelA/Pel-15E family pectate lyase